MPGRVEEGSGPDSFAHVFPFLSTITCRVHKLALFDQVPPLLRVSISDLVKILLAGPPMLGTRRFFFFYRGPNPLSEALSTANAPPLPSDIRTGAPLELLLKPIS